jgi:protein TonB
VNLIEDDSQKDKKRDRKRRGRFIPFLIASILLHLLIFLVISPYLLSSIARQTKPKEKPKFIEITDLPVPKEKETEPPKEAKRYAERSHQTPEEKTRDELTKKGSVSPLPRYKPQVRQPQQSKRVKTAEEKSKKEESIKESPQIASLPKKIEEDLKQPREKSAKEKLDNITKDQLFNVPSSQFSQGSPQEFQGSRDVKQEEDTVDLNTSEFKYFSYFAKLKQKIEQVWNYPEASRLSGEQGELFLVFTIRRDGYLEDVKLIESSLFVRLDDEAIRAIRAAAPFPPFPKSWELERLNVRAVFRYEIRYGWTVR